MTIHLIQVPELLLEVCSREPVGQQTQAWERVEEVSSRDDGFGEGRHKGFSVGDETLVGFDVIESVSYTHDDGSESAIRGVSGMAHRTFEDRQAHNRT